MRSQNIIDLHCDTLSYCAIEEDYHLRRNGGHVSLEKLKAGGFAAQCFAIFVPTGEAAKEFGTELPPYEFYCRAREIYQRELAKNTDMIRPALNSGDIARNLEANLLSAILTVEDAVLLEGELSRLDTLFHDGVRMVSLTWNTENSLGYPNHSEPAKMALGLKPFGKDCVRRMNELGMIVDVSHLSEGGFWDVASISSKPFVASHSCARALCDHPRNLADDQLRAIAEHGGVVGVNFCAEFLSVEHRDTKIEDIVGHMDYIRNVAGIDAAAFGSDFDGFENELEMGDCGGNYKICEALEKRFTPTEIEKICGGNFLRVFREVTGA